MSIPSRPDSSDFGISRFKGWIILCITLTGLAISGCTPGELAEPPENENLTEVVLPQPPKSVALDELFEIEEGGANPLFGSIGSQSFGDDGQIYVSDYQSMQVHEYSPEGAFVRSIGGPGEGPGEFQIPVMMRSFRDSLYVFDNRNYRVSVFDQATGSFVRSQNTDVEGWRAYRLLGVTSTNLVMYYSPVLGMNADYNNAPDDEIRLVPLSAEDASGASTIWKTPGNEWIPLEVNGMQMNRVKPLGKSSECAFQATTGICAYSSAVSVNLFSLEGDSLQTLTIPTEPRPVTTEERNDILEGFTVASVREQIVVADMHPEFNGFIVVDDVGRFWIRRQARDGVTEYWIIDPEDRTTQSVTIEGSALIYDIQQGRAIARLTHEEGLKTVRVYATPAW